MSDWLLIGISLLLVVACGIFVAGEFSFLGADRTRLQARADDGESGAHGALQAMSQLSSQLSGVQVGITLTNLAIGLLAEPAIRRQLDPLLSDWGVSELAARSISTAAALIVATFVTMLFGELVPKNLAIAHPESVAVSVQWFVRGFTTIARPISDALNAVANLIVRMLGVTPQEELASARSPEELLSLVNRSAVLGSLSGPAAGLLGRALTFDDKDAAEAMTPRTRVTSVSADSSMSDLLAVAAVSGRTRFPVTGADVDDIVGVVSVADAFAVEPTRRDAVRVGPAADHPTFVPSTLPLDDVMRAMFTASREFVVVVDEFGGMDGVITLEDLVEELVGDLEDENEAAPAPNLAVGPSAQWTLSGLLRPDEIADQTGLVIPDDGKYETLAGYVTSQLGRLAHVGDVVTADGLQMTVTALDGRRIETVEVRVHPEEESATDDGSGDPS